MGAVRKTDLLVVVDENYSATLHIPYAVAQTMAWFELFADLDKRSCEVLD